MRKRRIKQVAGQISINDISAKLSLKRKYPPGSLLTTEGCAYDDCFSCSAIGCRVRGEYSYCNFAPLGNPFPCETVKKAEESTAGFPISCQFIDQSLAYHRVGDNQPSPCCKDCTLDCAHRCSRSRKEQKERTIE